MSKGTETYIKISLDNTLRFLYDTIRYSRGKLVAIEFKHGGRVWRADTAQEAIALRRQLEAEDRQAVEFGEEPDWITESIWTADSVTDLLHGLGSQQKMFLKVLCERTEVKSDELMKPLSVGSEMALAGVLSGLSKQLKKLNIKPRDLYSVSVEWNGKEKTRSFRLAGNFRWAASEVGWPEKWF